MTNINFSDALTSYTAELVEIMQEVKAKMQRVNEIKSEIAKLTNTTKATDNNNNKISCKCGCTIYRNSWYNHIKTKKDLKKLKEVKEEVKEEIKEVEPVEEINK